MKRYQNMKDSGVEWIGKIPEHWDLVRLKHLSNVQPSNVDKHIYVNEIQVKLCNYTDVYYNEKIDSKTELKKGSVNQSEYSKFKLEVDDVILTKDSESADDIGIPVFVKETLDNVVCAYHLTQIKPNRDKIEGLFIFRFIQSNGVRSHFEVEANGITRFGLGKASIENLLISIPSQPEQVQIVSFLDEKTSKIDELISKKERKIELLKEQRKALINQAVTKGLNPSAPMKDSGVEWIGEIPEGWELKKLKYLYDYQKGYAFKSKIFSDKGRRVVKASDIKNLTLTTNDTFITEFESEKYLDYSLNENDFVLSTVGSKYTVSDSAVGQLAIVPEEFDGALLNQNTVRLFKKKSSLCNDYFMFLLLQSKYFRSHLDIHSHGTANQASINVEDILNFQFYLPKIRVQNEIIEYFRYKSHEIVELLNKESQKIELLKEYRQSLISEVVTGKIDVREEVEV